MPARVGHQGTRRGPAGRDRHDPRWDALALSPEKTLITHIDEGLVFLGWRIQRHRKRGTGRHYVYVYPAKKALAAVVWDAAPSPSIAV